MSIAPTVGDLRARAQPVERCPGQIAQHPKCKNGDANRNPCCAIEREAKLTFAKSFGDRIPSEPKRAEHKDGDEQDIVVKRSHDVAVQKCVESSGHPASRAIEAGGRLECTGREDVRRVRVNNPNGNAPSEGNASSDPNSGATVAGTRWCIGWRGSAVIRRFDRVRQHGISLRLASPSTSVVA